MRKLFAALALSGVLAVAAPVPNASAIQLCVHVAYYWTPYGAIGQLGCYKESFFEALVSSWFF